MVKCGPGIRPRPRSATQVKWFAFLCVALLGGCSPEQCQTFRNWRTNPQRNAGENVPGLERLWLPIDGGRVEAWFLPGRGVSASCPGPVVLHAHGNAELIEGIEPFFAPYREAGVSVLLCEYRGYGRSDGRPSQRSITDDFVRFRDLIAKRPDVDSDRIIYHGRSLGAAVVCSLALRRLPAALILHGAFTSISAQAHVPESWLENPFNNLAAIPLLHCPILIVHGRNDMIVPYSHGVALYSAALDSRDAGDPPVQMLTLEGGHAPGKSDQELLAEAIGRFLTEAGIQRTSGLEGGPELMGAR